MQIILFPDGGLANRMRAIDSVVNLCRTKDHLTVVWYKDWGMNCAWGALFEPLPFIKDKPISKLWRYVLRHHEDKSIVKKGLALLKRFRILWFCDLRGDEYIPLIQQVSRGGYLWVVIRSWEAFYPSVVFRKEIFVLKDRDRLEKELSKVDDNTIGVHIRRTDNTWSVTNSPVELFEKKMKEELSVCPETKFYLCSDDESVKEHFRHGEWEGKVVSPDGIIGRGSVDGIVQAAIEMFTLAHTRKIYGSFWSSFGEIAARLGDIPIEICSTSSVS